MKTAETPLYAMFSEKEMMRRWQCAQDLMLEQGLDVLMISGEENFQYFAGTSASLALHASLTRPSLFILPKNRDPIIITQGRGNLTLSCYVRDIRDYSEILQFPTQLTLDVLKEVTTANNRIGLELGHEQRIGMPVGVCLELAEALPDIQFVDASKIFIQLRMVKSDEEIAYIREAAEITARARQRLFGLVRQRMTERDVARLMRQLILEEGGDNTSFVILQLDLPGSGNTFNYDRPLKKQMVLAVDTGARVGMYTIDYARMGILGTATPAQKEMHQKVLQVNEAMKEALRPGVKCSEVYQVGVRAIEEVGLEIFGTFGVLEGRMGHGQGILATEPPSIAGEDHTVLEPGMVISTEPAVCQGDLHFQWEDVHVITPEGSEQLTQETSELREVPF